MGRLKQKSAPSIRHYEQHHYAKFRKLDGSHPLKQVTPDAFVEYQVRQRHGGKVAFFNFALGKEMGLIPADHPEVLTESLKTMILETFGIVIINEYDQMHGIKFPEKDIKKNKYMATRYLQLQHPNKKGKTSGDGRSIWNGQISHKGKFWDVSSCGTGATKLSPATHLQKKFFQTGDPTISYGCGYSEVDEGLSALFFSEVMHTNKIETEQVLAIIEYQKGLSINVRAHCNLLRPSHFFNHLKQGNHTALKAMVEYHISLQSKNGVWNKIPKQSNKRYEYFLQRMTEIFANMSANFEDEYIFCWLDWDGDNILMDGGIIDYGSIRQFGLFHSEYRYDDVQRYSTSILEQKLKARYTIQTFAQLVDFLITKRKRNIKHYRRHNCLRNFDRIFEAKKNSNLLYKIGLPEKYQSYLLNHHNQMVTSFRKTFSYFEQAKSQAGIHEVADGINWNAIFCMRDILRELPQLYLYRGEFITNDEFIQIIKSSYAKKNDLVITAYRKRNIAKFQQDYWRMVKILAKQFKHREEQILLDICKRSCFINKYDRVTGDSITTVVDKVMHKRPKFGPEEIYQLMKDFTRYQNLNPGQHGSEKYGGQRSPFLKGLFKIVRDYREGL